MSEHEAAQQRPTQAPRPLRILVENSEYWLRNNGDLAMLTVTLDRMHRRWPDARIAGAYHLAVFALSQSIPVVALTSTAYYDDKFLRLSAMFGQGLTLVRLDDPCLEQTLAMAIDRAWQAAMVVREPLRARARTQIDASRAAFDRVATLTQAGPTAGTDLPR